MYTPQIINQYNDVYKYKSDLSENFIFNHIHPKLEIKRRKYLIKFMDRYYNICREYDNKYLRKKADDQILKFCWSNLSIDPVIPYKDNYNTMQLSTDLKNFSLDPIKVIEKLKIKKYFKNKIKKFKKYYQKIKLKKYENVEYINNSLIYNKNVIQITQKQYNRFMQYFKNYKSETGDQQNMQLVLIFCILYRYAYMGADNNQLSVDINLKHDIFNVMGVNFELFGSSINRYYSNYCSLNYDLEKYFGSAGNFFKTTFTKGLYFANPPFDEQLMSSMASHMIECLNLTTDNMGFICFIPVWDNELQKKFSKICKTPVYNDYGVYAVYDILTKSKFFKKKYVFCKNNFPYYDFIKERTIYIPVNTLIILISNYLIDLNVLENIFVKNNLKPQLL